MTAVKYPHLFSRHQMLVMSVCRIWLLAVISNGLPCALEMGLLPGSQESPRLEQSCGLLQV
jgi:hypothetical protein